MTRFKKLKAYKPTRLYGIDDKKVRIISMLNCE
jgi:hypothetical protein